MHYFILFYFIYIYLYNTSLETLFMSILSINEAGTVLIIKY